MLSLSATCVRMYRKGSGDVSMRLRGFMVVPCGKASFSLTSYMHDISCELELPNNEVLSFDWVGISEACEYALETMFYDFSAAATAKPDVLRYKAGRLRLTYDLFHHPSVPARVLEYVVPLVRRGP